MKIIINIIKSNSTYQDVEFKIDRLFIDKFIDTNYLITNKIFNDYYSFSTNINKVNVKRIYFIHSLTTLLINLSKMSTKPVYYPYELLDEGIGFLVFRKLTNQKISCQSAYIYYGSRYNPSNSDIELISQQGKNMDNANLQQESEIIELDYIDMFRESLQSINSMQTDIVNSKC